MAAAVSARGPSFAPVRARRRRRSEALALVGLRQSRDRPAEAAPRRCCWGARVGVVVFVAAVTRSLAGSCRDAGPKDTHLEFSPLCAPGANRPPSVFVAWACRGCNRGTVHTAASSVIYRHRWPVPPYESGDGAARLLFARTFARRWIRRYGMAGTAKPGGASRWQRVASSPHRAASNRCGVADDPLPVKVDTQCIACGRRLVGPFPSKAGAASALAGFILALLAFAIGRGLGGALDGTLRPLAWGVGFWAAATAFVAWTLVQRRPL